LRLRGSSMAAVYAVAPACDFTWSM
jgi:hypothetical protein